jgi:hypothetical protein
VETDDGLIDECDPCTELKIISEKLQETFSLAWALPGCGQDFEIIRNGASDGQGLVGLSKKIDGLYQVLRVLHDNTRCASDEPISAISLTPEWWQVRTGAKRPQLLVIYRGKNEDGSWNNIRRQSSIPQVNSNQRKVLKSILPKSINKGAIQGICTLSDNSKIIQYCSSKTEAERVIKAFLRVVKNGFKTTDIKVGEIKGSKVREFMKGTLYAYEAHYYATGQGQNTPNWVEKLF